MAFDLNTGALKWKCEGDAPSAGSPVVAKLQGVEQLVAVGSQTLVGVSLTDGKQLWNMPYPAKRINCATPLVDGDRIFLTGEDLGLSAVKIGMESNAFSATLMWTNKSLPGRFTTPLLRDGKLYGYAGQFYCADALTGATVWKSTTAAAGGNGASLLDAGSVLMGLTVKGDMVAYKPSDTEYSELARYKVADKEAWAHPIVAGRRLFVRDEDSVALWTE